MLTFLLDVIEVPESHTGITLAKVFQSMLEQFGLTKKILAITADNATSNDTQVTKLAKFENTFESANRVRCFNHTIQLAAKALLQPLNPAIAGKEEDDIEDDIENLPLPINTDDEEDGSDEAAAEGDYTDDLGDDPDDGIDEMEVIGDAAKEQIVYNTEIIRDAITKLRQLAFAVVRSSTKVAPAWRAHCEESGLKPNLIPRDVVTRWNSTYDMMEFALRYKAVIDRITVDKKLPQLRKYELGEDEWEVIEDLASVLERYKQATVFFSQNSASVAAVIPAMDKLDSHLNQKSQQGLSSSIVSAMKLARNKMDRYWKSTDDSNIYRIAMVLHPGLKLKYFHAHNWDTEWIDAAENIVHEEWIGQYKNQVTPDSDPTQAADEIGVNNVADVTGDFGNISLAQVSSTDELEEYLRKPNESVKDPLKWWNENKTKYPNLHRMALDYLSIPATSTAVERVFSQGRQLLHFTRNRLSGRSVRAFLCLGSWSRHDLITLEDIIAAIRPKKRKRGESESVAV